MPASHRHAVTLSDVDSRAFSTLRHHLLFSYYLQTLTELREYGLMYIAPPSCYL